MRRLPELAIALLALTGCGTPDECDELCDAALVTVEACLDEWGLHWGESFGYLGPDDHANWCATFIGEQLELGQARWGATEGHERVTEACIDQATLLEDRSCTDYAVSWDVWSGFSEGD